MPPLPILFLLPAVATAELTIVSVPFAKIDTIRMVFAVIPLMVVMMTAIVVAMMIDAASHYHFLGSEGLWCCRYSESGCQDRQT